MTEAVRLLQNVEDPIGFVTFRCSANITLKEDLSLCEENQASERERKEMKCLCNQYVSLLKTKCIQPYSVSGSEGLKYFHFWRFVP